MIERAQWYKRVFMPVGATIFLCFIMFILLASFSTLAYADADSETPDEILLKDTQKAETLVRAYIENYLAHFALNHTIDTIIIEETSGRLIYDLPPAPPTRQYNALVTFTDGAIALIPFTAVFVNEFEGVEPSLDPVIMSEEGGTFYLRGCISSKAECSVLDRGGYIDCTGALIASGRDETNLASYFSCQCVFDYREDLHKYTDVESCGDCWSLPEPGAREFQRSCIDGPEGGKVCDMWVSYYRNQCELNFSLSLNSSADNTLLISIESPNAVPEVTIKKWGDESCEFTTPLNPGLNVLETNCSYEEYSCVRVYYQDNLITDGDCSYRTLREPETASSRFFSDVGRIPIYFILYVGVIVLFLRKSREKDIKKYENLVSVHPDKGFLWPTKPKLYLFFLTVAIWVHDNFLNISMVGSVLMPVSQADFVLRQPLLDILTLTRLSILFTSRHTYLIIIILQFIYWYVAISFLVHMWYSLKTKKYLLLLKSKVSLVIFVLLLLAFFNNAIMGLHLILQLDSSTKGAIKECQGNFSGYYEGQCIGEVIEQVVDVDPALALKMTEHYSVYTGPTLVKVVSIYAQEDIDRAYWLCRRNSLTFGSHWKCLMHVVTSGKPEDIPRIVEICEEYDELVPWSYRRGECWEHAKEYFATRNNVSFEEFCSNAQTQEDLDICAAYEPPPRTIWPSEIATIAAENVSQAYELCESDRTNSKYTGKWEMCREMIKHDLDDVDDQMLYGLAKETGEYSLMGFAGRKAELLESDPGRFDFCINAKTEMDKHICSYHTLLPHLIDDEIISNIFSENPLGVQQLCKNGLWEPLYNRSRYVGLEVGSYPLCEKIQEATTVELAEMCTGNSTSWLQCTSLLGADRSTLVDKMMAGCVALEDGLRWKQHQCYKEVAARSQEVSFCAKVGNDASACAIEIDADKTHPLEELEAVCRDLVGMGAHPEYQCYKDIALHRQEISLCGKAGNDASACAIEIDADKTHPLEELEAVCRDMDGIGAHPEYQCYKDIALHRQEISLCEKAGYLKDNCLEELGE